MADRGERRLAAILSADVAGYSKLMGDDERATVLTLTEYREVFADHIARHKGRVIDSPGDNLLAEFPSPVEAVDAARDIQHALGRRNRQLAEHRQMQFRIGLNLGDVIAKEDGTIYGDGVNIAARLEGIAEPGGICLSETIFLQTEGKVEAAFEDIGSHEVKNITKPVRTYRVMTDMSTAPITRPAGRMARTNVVVAAVVVVLIVVGIAFWLGKVRPTTPPPKIAGQLEDSILALPTGPSIAVLPFDNLSGDPEQDYFAEGLAGDISTLLSQQPDLTIIGRGATSKYQGQSVDITTVGTELGTNFVLKGTVQRTAQKIRITTALFDTADGHQIWANTYDRELDTASLFSIQDEIAQSTVATVADQYGVISRVVRRNLHRDATVSLSSYECVLLFYEYFQIYTLELHARVRNCLEQSVKRDPEYADAWGRLGMVYAHEYSMGLNPRPGSLERALKAAQTGVRADPNSQMSYEGLAATYYFSHDRERFLQAADRAVSLNPNDVSTIANMGYYMSTWGMYSRGLPLLDKAIKLSPFTVFWYWVPYWQQAFENGDYETALDYAEKANLPGLYYSQMRFVPTYAKLGRLDQARDELRTLLELKPDFPNRVREEWRFWNTPEHVIEKLIQGYRDAGMVVADEETVTN